MLKTKRLNLRPFSSTDLDLLFSLHANEKVAKTTIDGVQSLETVKKHLDNFISHQEKFGYSQWAVFEKETTKFVGRAGLTTRALNKEIGEKTEVRFALLPEFWGKGYASELTCEMVKFAFEELQLEILAAANGPTNEKSHRVLIKNGFQFIDKIIPESYGSEGEVRYYLITREEFLNFKS